MIDVILDGEKERSELQASDSGWYQLGTILKAQQELADLHVRIAELEQQFLGRDILLGKQAVRIHELEAQTQWQPIETAPKDGTQCLLSNDVYKEIAGWDELNNSWICTAGFIEFIPTHWMPLPKPPKG